MKKLGLYRIFCIIILVFLIIYFVYELLIAEEKDIRHTYKALSLIVVYGAAVLKNQISGGPSVSQKRVYEDAYGHIISNSFVSNPSARRKLLKAIYFYNLSKNKKGLAVLEKLTDKCETQYDTAAVLYFKGVCHTEMCEYNAAAGCFEELLRTDATNADAWALLGCSYERTGKMQKAVDSYKNALRYDPGNSIACNNLASVSIQTGQPDDALKYALQLLESDPGMIKAAGFAAAAYAMKNDRENAEIYLERYKNSGGTDLKDLKKWMDDIFEKNDMIR